MGFRQSIPIFLKINGYRKILVIGYVSTTLT